ACLASLSPRHLAFYLDQVGLQALSAGDLSTAREFIDLAIRNHRDRGNVNDLCVALRNRADCLSVQGQTRLAVQAAGDALALAFESGNRDHIRKAYAFVASAAEMAGNSVAADTQFRAADQMEFADYGRHLSSLRGAQWGWF